MDFAKEMETRHQGSESRGPALCQEAWDFCGTIESRRDKSFSNGGCFPLPTPRLDVTRRKVGASLNSNKELARK